MLPSPNQPKLHCKTEDTVGDEKSAERELKVLSRNVTEQIDTHWESDNAANDEWRNS